mmetsp:Transcript_17708/g.42661  ORF Transcript_17708/g.42661 Transcript_17708/m.42661 type:complete len:530 (+) Transcript_17708:86-1675(+)
MSFTNHSNNNNTPDTGAVSDQSTIVSNLTDNSNSRASRTSSSRLTDRSDDSSSLRRDREREGRCADCGAETHEMRHDPETGTARKVPLNIEGEVHRGRCLLCNPLPTRLCSTQPHNLTSQQQQHYRRQLESVQSGDGGSFVAQQHHLQDRRSYWMESPQFRYSSSQSLNNGDSTRRPHHDQRSQRRAGRSDDSVGSIHSYNSAPMQSYNTISTQSYSSAPVYSMSTHESQHSNSNTWPIGVPSSSDINRSAGTARAAPPLDQFTISSSRGGGRSQQQEEHSSQRSHRQEQHPHEQYYQNSSAASNNIIASDQVDNMAMDETQGQNFNEYSYSPANSSTSQSQQHQSQQQRQQQQSQSPSDNKEPAIHQILSSMQRYPNHIPTQSKGLHSLWVLSWDDANTASIGRLGGIPQILNSMRSHPNTPTLQSNGIAALQNLAMTSHNRDIIINSDGVKVLVEAMAQFVDDKALQQSGCTALANLADGGPDQKARVAEDGGILAMMQAVNAHRGDESILRAAYQALRKLGYDPGS